MKKFLASLAAAAIVTLGGVAGAQPATATESPAPEVCVPAAAWTETIPAKGTPTIPNPEYVPGKDAWTETIEHPAVPAQGEPYIKNPEYVPPVPETTEQRLVKEAWDEEVLVSPAVEEVPEVSHTDYEWKTLVLSKGWQYRWVHSDKDGTFYDGKVWLKTGKTQKHVEVEYVPGKPAVYETVHHPAEYETVTIPGKPAQGQPVIKNPNYVPAKEAWTETVEHPAVPPTGESTIPNPEFVPERIVDHPAVDCQGNVTALIQTRCIDGSVYLAVRVDNGTGGPVVVRSSLTGTVTVEAGKAFFQSYDQKASSVERGSVILNLRNDGGAWTKTLRYSATSCEVTPPVTEEPTPQPEPEVPTVAAPPSTSKPASPVVSLVSHPVQRVNAPQTAANKPLASGDGSLAQTGVNGAHAALLAGVLVGTGVVVVAATRRRAQRAS